MKATLEFNLPDDQDQFTLAKNGPAWWRVVWDEDTWLRNKLKYGHTFKTPDEALQACRDNLREIMSVEHVNLEEVS